MIVTEHSPTKKTYAAIVSYRTDLRSDLVCIDENEKRLLKANSATHRETISPVKLPSVIPNPFMEVSTMMVNPSKLEEVFSMWGELLFIGINMWLSCERFPIQPEHHLPIFRSTPAGCREMIET